MLRDQWKLMGSCYGQCYEFTVCRRKSYVVGQCCKLLGTDVDPLLLVSVTSPMFTDRGQLLMVKTTSLQWTEVDLTSWFYGA